VLLDNLIPGSDSHRTAARSAFFTPTWESDTLAAAIRSRIAEG
jgi:hypothetical protein